MSKGLTLDQFRSALDSDARREVETQKHLVEILNNTIKDKDKEIEELRDRFRVMCNRCYVSARGVLCAFCGYKDECHVYKDVKEEEIE